jgi:hypothetical protein
VQDIGLTCFSFHALVGVVSHPEGSAYQFAIGFVAPSGIEASQQASQLVLGYFFVVRSFHG